MEPATGDYEKERGGATIIDAPLTAFFADFQFVCRRNGSGSSRSAC
jgi:hypothetical protein